MRKVLCVFCAFVMLLLVGCGAVDSRNEITCSDVIAVYEESGYEVWHKEYTLLERDYLCEIVVDDDEGNSIYFTFYDSAEKAAEHVGNSRWNVFLWIYSLASGNPMWVYTEVYNTIAIEYDNKALYAPFRTLK